MSSNPPEEARSQLKQVSNNGNAQPHTPAQQQQSAVAPSAGKARLQCHACNRLLEYDAGAQYVQCFSCSTMNAVQAGTHIGGRVLSMLCAICHTTNLAPYGINYVRCGSCSTISQVSHAYRGQPDRVPSAQPPGHDSSSGPMSQQDNRQQQRTDFPQSTPNFDDVVSQQSSPDETNLSHELQ